MKCFQNLTRLLKKNFIGDRHIVIVLSNEALSFTALTNNKIIDRLFVNIIYQNSIDSYQHFLKKYRKFQISIVRDDNKCELIHENIPALQSILNINPVEQFINEYYDVSDIIAYNVYNIENKIEEIWSTLIVKAPCDQPLEILIEHILGNSFKIGGIYFLLLEYISIIDKILVLTNNLQYENFLQIVCYISRFDSIKFVVKYQSNILASKSIQYPLDKSALYVQGIIEQEISDYLIYFKNFQSKNNTEICTIFLIDGALYDLLKMSNSDSSKFICLSIADILDISREDSSECADDLIMKLFLKNKNFIASNQNIRTINTMKRAGSMIFKPLNILIIILVTISLLIKFVTDENIKKYTAINNEKYKALQEYREIKLQFLTNEDITDLVDYKNLTMAINALAITPIDLLQKLSHQLNENVHIDQIKWYYSSFNNIVQNSQLAEMKMSFKFTTHNTSVKNSIEKLNLYTKHLGGYFGNYSVLIILETDQITSLLDRVEIPAVLVFTYSGKL